MYPLSLVIIGVSFTELKMIKANTIVKINERYYFDDGRLLLLSLYSFNSTPKPRMYLDDEENHIKPF